MFPTRYGKSLIQVYELLPIACKEELSVDAFVFVIEPLNAIIEQQKKRLRDTLCICLKRNFNWVGYNTVAVAYIEQLILIRLFLIDTVHAFLNVNFS